MLTFSHFEAQRAKKCPLLVLRSSQSEEVVLTSKREFDPFRNLKFDCCANLVLRNSKNDQVLKS
jgi:hypothetical protein